MTSQDILTSVEKAFPDAGVALQQGQAGDPWLLVPADRIIAILTYLKANHGFIFLSCLGGIDYITHLAVIYVVRSYAERCEITVKVHLPHEEARIETASELYGNANWFERETLDLFGIEFIGHSDPRRIMMPEDWVGHPLRKDYVEAPDYHGIPTARPDSHAQLDYLYPAKPAPEGGAAPEGA